MIICNKETFPMDLLVVLDEDSILLIHLGNCKNIDLNKKLFFTPKPTQHSSSSSSSPPRVKSKHLQKLCSRVEHQHPSTRCHLIQFGSTERGCIMHRCILQRNSSLLFPTLQCASPLQFARQQTAKSKSRKVDEWSAHTD